MATDGSREEYRSLQSDGGVGTGRSDDISCVVFDEEVGYDRRFRWSIGDYPRCISVGDGGYGRFGGRRVSTTAVGDGGGGGAW
mmetsp:Transcript_16/g.39  ORF Transcript_16/g.39 Transcript_16/m.39 type:complete len:83 (+) Transcript_16:1634-1882(+)